MKPLALRSLRVRLTLWYVALLALILAAFSGLVYVSLERRLRFEQDRLLEAEATQLVGGLDLRLGVPRFTEGAGLPQPGMVVALYDVTGQRFVANDARQPLPLLRDALNRALDGQQSLTTETLGAGERWRILTVPLSLSGRLIGVLQVGRSEREIDEALRQLLALLLVAVPATLVVASVGGLFLAARALDPIDEVTRAADEIGERELGRRIAVPASDDEVGRLAATFNRMLDRLDQAFRRQRQFTADASHELRTPLAALASELDLALGRSRDADEYRQALERLRVDTERLNRLLNALLTLSRSEAGQAQVELEPLRLDQLAADVVESLQPLAQAREVTLRLEPAEPVELAGDQTGLTQLLVNLVDNALKYTPAGGEASVAVRQEDGWSVLEVNDSGIGIAPEHLAHVFDRFYRVDRARSRADGAAGLGLAIAQAIAQAHGGEISVRSRLGEGSVFSARLPLSVTAKRPSKVSSKA